MYIANIRSRVFRKFLLLSRVNQYNDHFLLKVFGVKCRGQYLLSPSTCHSQLSVIEQFLLPFYLLIPSL